MQTVTVCAQTAFSVEKLIMQAENTQAAQHS